jgi:hypothetical protein
LNIYSQALEPQGKRKYEVNQITTPLTPSIVYYMDVDNEKREITITLPSSNQTFTLNELETNLVAEALSLQVQNWDIYANNGYHSYDLS